jgi:hypothetical protein
MLLAWSIAGESQRSALRAGENNRESRDSASAASRSIADWFREFSGIAPQCELTRSVIFVPQFF